MQSKIATKLCYFRVTDSASNVGTATVTITITDFNEAAPVFGKTSYTVCVADGSAAGEFTLCMLGKILSA
jgi:hypothetical protein